MTVVIWIFLPRGASPQSTRTDAVPIEVEALPLWRRGMICPVRRQRSTGRSQCVWIATSGGAYDGREPSRDSARVESRSPGRVSCKQTVEMAQHVCNWRA
ncbi:hypothetical protein F5X68DRAFT_209101 [Plectosphaerella plurivora]|uniref:Uncharacterized protein n=1 Tax=Plectosphaerella plurivora TaxID=936078 RepID=A0A9P8VB01_9PEZI|nr:hypothetical protein F5X68DRAFT_209101 [Plectosphaerella plurivora]